MEPEQPCLSCGACCWWWWWLHEEEHRTHMGITLSKSSVESDDDEGNIMEISPILAVKNVSYICRIIGTDPWENTLVSINYWTP